MIAGGNDSNSTQMRLKKKFLQLISVSSSEIRITFNNEARKKVEKKFFIEKDHKKRKWEKFDHFFCLGAGLTALER